MNTKIYNKWYFLLILLPLLLSCGKDFLEPKSTSAIVIPKTLDDFEKILDNSVINTGAGLPLLSCDDYFIGDSALWASASATQKNTYIWAADIYEGGTEIADWNIVYRSVFYSNSVLLQLSQSEVYADQDRADFTKGWAHFVRAAAFYDLLKNFSQTYKSETEAKVNLGIPLKLTANVDEIQQRASVWDGYQQVIADLNVAIPLLPKEIPTVYRNRPSRPAAYALLAKVYLSMLDYTQAELYADSCLSLYDKLMDYNLIDRNAVTPFKKTNDEVLLYANQVNGQYNYVLYNPTVNIMVDTVLYKSYKDGDLRKQLFFIKNGLFIKPKRGYAETLSLSFTGLATDEVYLIKSECAARRSDVPVALDYLNKLLQKRFTVESYKAVSINNPKLLLEEIKKERRKELFWRAGIRWEDIKRYNDEGEQIILSRKLGSKSYQLLPGSPRYIFPIPDDEITLSRIIQNPR